MSGTKRRILYLSCTQPFAPFSGYAYRTVGILKWLAERYAVDVVYEGSPEEIRGGFVPLERLGRVECVQSERGILRLLRAALGRLPHHHVLHSTPGFSNAVSRLAEEAEYDLIWMNKTVHYPVLERWPGHPPVIVDQHAEESSVWDNLISSDPRPHVRLYCRWNRWRDLKYTRRVYDEAAGVVSISVDDFARTRALYPDIKTIYVPQGVDPEYYAPHDPAQAAPEVLLFSGTDAVRNVQAVRRFTEHIMPLVRDVRPEARLVWIGNVNRAKWDFLARPWLETTGFVDHVPPYFDRGMIYVSPFDMGEGMKTKIVEALAMGKVIVSTPVGISGLRAEGLPFIKVCDSDHDFAAAVLTFMNNPRLLELGRMAREYAIRNFSWNQVLAPLAPFIEQAVKR